MGLVRAYGDLGNADAEQTQREALVTHFQPSLDHGPALLQGVVVAALRTGHGDRAAEIVEALRASVEKLDRLASVALALPLDALTEAVELLRDGRDAEAALCLLFFWDETFDDLGALSDLIAERVETRDAIVAAAIYDRDDGGRAKHAALFDALEDDTDLETQALDHIAETLAGDLQASAESQETVSGLRYRAILALAKDDYEDAAALARRAVALDAKDLRAQIVLLRILETILEREVEAGGEEDEGSFGDGDGEEMIGASAEFLDCIRAGLGIAPSHLLFVRALALYGPDPAEALAASELLMIVDPTDEDVLRARADRLRQLGNLEELAEHVAYMLSLESDDTNAVLRARQALLDEAHRAQGEQHEMNSWLKILIAVAIATAVALLIWKSSGS